MAEVSLKVVAPIVLDSSMASSSVISSLLNKSLLFPANPMTIINKIILYKIKTYSDFLKNFLQLVYTNNSEFLQNYLYL